MGQKPEPFTISSDRDGLMAQVKESTAGLYKFKISHLTVYRQQHLLTMMRGAHKGPAP